MIRSMRVSTEEGSAGARLFFAAALPAFVIYLRTLAPTVTAEDSGELITAAYTLGIAHPPGYPLWCLLGKLFTFIPLGSVAWRVNLLSAALGAASAGVLALIAERFTRSFYASLAAALIFASSRDFWGQAVIAEVYTLNVLLFLLLLFFILRFEDTRRTRWLYLAASTLGLALTNHSTIIPLAPVFFGWVFLRHPELFRMPVLLLNLLGAFLLGFSIILYLPIRSAVDPPVDWGNPETLSATLDHFLRRQYTAAEVPRPRTLEGQATLVISFLETFARQFTPFLAWLALPGAMRLWKRDRAASVLLLALFVLTSYGFIWLLNYPPDRENLHLTRVFFLPAHAVGAVWIALGIRRIADWARARFEAWPVARWAALSAIGMIAVLLPLRTHFLSNDESRSYLAEEWGRNILESLPPDAIIVPSADHSTFPLVYLQAAEGLRPDVLVADRYGYIDDAALEKLFDGKDVPRAPPPPMGSEPWERERYLVEKSGRPVYLTTKSRIPGLETHEIVTWGLIFEAVRKDAKPEEAKHEALWKGYRFRPGSLERPPGNFSYDLILSDYHYARGRWALLFGREKEALLEIARSERHGSGVKEIHNNLGGTLAECGKADLAIPCLLHALAVDPEYDLATRNIANAYFTLKRYAEGLPWFDRALGLDPDNPVARLGKARAHRALGQAADAYFAYMRVFRSDPRSETLRSEIKEFVQKEFGKESTLADLGPAAPRLTRPDPFDDFHGGAPASSPARPWDGLASPLAIPPDPLEALGQ